MEIKDKREKEEVPSGIRLMLLLKERLVEIMDRERANQNSIHLYCTGAYWVAFECSAYQLYRAFPDSETMPLRLFAYPFPIHDLCQTLTQQVHQPEAGRNLARLSLFSHIFHLSLCATFTYQLIPCPSQRS